MAHQAKGNGLKSIKRICRNLTGIEHYAPMLPFRNFPTLIDDMYQLGKRKDRSKDEHLFLYVSFQDKYDMKEDVGYLDFCSLDRVPLQRKEYIIPRMKLELN